MLKVKMVSLKRFLQSTLFNQHYLSIPQYIQVAEGIVFRMLKVISSPIIYTYIYIFFFFNFQSAFKLNQFPPFFAVFAFYILPFSGTLLLQGWIWRICKRVFQIASFGTLWRKIQRVSGVPSVILS